MPNDEQWKRDAALRRAARAASAPEPAPGEKPGERPGAKSGTTADDKPAKHAERRPSGSAQRSGPDAYRATDGPPVVPPYPSRVDLHTHSRRSDGVLEPLELVTEAAAAGVQVLGLADHDTLAGARELLAPDRPPLPLTLLPSVEMNAVATGIKDLWESELHILGLGVDIHDDFFEATLAAQRKQRLIRFNRIVDRLGQMGYPIGDKVDAYLAASGSTPGASLGRPQIARCLVAALFARSVDDAMQKFLVRGRPAYVPREGLGPMEAISAIRGAGGLPVLAHFAEADDRRDLVAELKAGGLGGLEVHYRHFDADTVARLEEVASDLSLIPTGGSDYHGDGRSYAEVHAEMFVPDEDATVLFDCLGRPRLTIVGGVSAS